MFVKDKELDVKKGLSIVPERKALIANSSDAYIDTNYKVNETAKLVHPGFIKAKVTSIKQCNLVSKVITFEATNGAFPYFNAGQYVTLTKKIGNSLVTRPYSIFSSPKEAVNNKLELGIQDAGFFSHYINSELKLGDIVLISEPLGDFYHDTLRDKKHIFAIAGGSGVTPFVSMAKAIFEGSEDFNLTILYGIKKLTDSMFDFNTIKDPRIKVIPVLSDETLPGYEHGFINSEILKKYMPENCSIFMCGPDVMYKFVTKELLSIGVDANKIRKEHNCAKKIDVLNKEYNIKVHIRDEVYNVKANSNEPILVALEKAGIPAPSRCRSGHCGYCHARLISGQVKTPNEYDHVRLADKQFNYIHPCCSFIESDIEIEINARDELRGI